MSNMTEPFEEQRKLWKPIEERRLRAMILGHIEQEKERIADQIMLRIMQAEAKKMEELMDSLPIIATVQHEPGSLTERFRKEVKEIREAAERGDYVEPAGMGPVETEYFTAGYKVYREMACPCIEIEYPDDDDPDEEKDELNGIVLACADDILNTDGGDEQKRLTEEKIHRKWMDIHGSGYRDCRTKVVIEREPGERAKVKFLVYFAY